MNDKKILIVFHCLLLKSVTGFWDFPNEKDTNRMDIPKNPSDFFFVTDYNPNQRSGY